MSRFFRILLTITALAHVPVAIALGEAARRLALPLPWLLGPLVAVGAFGVFASRAGAGLSDHKRNEALLRLVDIPFFVHFCGALFSVVPFVVGLLAAPFVGAARFAAFTMWTYAVGLLVCGYGVLVRRRWFVVKEVDVEVAGLDRRLDGFRVVHLSDLHIGALTPRSWGERWIRAANALDADVAVVTGDMVTSGVEFHEDIAAVVSQLRARQGTFVSMGNHDYFGEGEPLVSLLREGGSRVLRNEGVVVEKDGARLFLSAIDDTWTRRDDMGRALADRPDGVPCVLLAHDPKRFVEAAERGVELVLSGHTHGGQIAMPFLYRWLSLSHLTHPFHVGLYRRDRSTLYVHPGLGTTGPPIRLGVAPAVVLLKLRAGSPESRAG
jgi:predicted MPP superfamily phosphohydrolase